MLPAVTRPRNAVLIAALAFGPAWLAANAADPEGDTKTAIADVERQIGTVGKVLRRHTYELRDETAQMPNDTSRSLYRMTGQKGERFYFEGPAEPRGVDPNEIAVELFLKKNKIFVSYDSAWAEMEVIWSRLAPSNQRIARAKALRHFALRPSSVPSEEWQERIRSSEESWRIR